MENPTFNKINNMDKMDFQCKENGEVYKKVIFEPIRIGPISTLDEMDSKVLQFQNKKLEMKLEEYQRIENELQQRIQQLEKRQNQDETVLNIVNTYWNQLNDDVGAILLDVDDEYDTDQISSETALNFVNELTSWDETQIDEKLMNSVQISTSAMAKIIRAYDHMLSKNYKILSSLKLQAAEDTSIDSANDIDYTDSKIKHKLNFDNHDKRLPKVNNHHTTLEKQDRKRIKLDQQNESSKETKPVDRTDSDIVTQSKKETTSFTKIFSNRHSTSSNKVTCDSYRNHESYKERASNRSDNSSHNHNLDVVCNGKSKTDIENENQDQNSSDIDREVKAVLTEIMDKVMAQSKPPAEQIFFGDDDKIRAYVEKQKAKRDNDQVFRDESETICDKELKNICVEVTHDNVRLQNIISAFQNHQQKIIANEQKIDDDLNVKMREFEEWKSRVDDKEYENEKLKCKKFKIERHLSEAAETLEKLKVRKRNRTKSDPSVTGGKKNEEFEEELQLQREIASNRAEELETLRAKYQSSLNAIEELEKKLNDIPDEVIEESTEFKCLQSQFSVLHNETILIKDQIEEYHSHIQTLNATFVNKMEMTETEDLMTLRKLQTDLLQVQQKNTALREQYERLKNDFEFHTTINEQTGPLNKEMRHLLIRLQKHTKHLKHEAQRYKRKYKELSTELNLLSKQSYADSKFKLENENSNSSDFDDADFGFDVNDDFIDVPVKDDAVVEVKNEKLDSGYDDLLDSSLSLYDRPIVAIAIKQEPEISSPESPPPVPGPSKTCSRTKKRQRDTLQECREALKRSNKELQELLEVEELEDEKIFEDEYVQDLKSQLKKAETEQKELKLLLDMYKSVNRDKREKHQLAMAEKKLKSDIEEAKNQMKRILEIKRENRKKLADEDALRKIKYLEEQNFSLLRQINIHKQEEEALLSEMEVTNQAFEDMQEQNSRLIQQLREKGNANSKLIAESMKSTLLYDITCDEKENLQALMSATSKQLDSVTTVMKELEEKELVYQTAINNVEKEINLRQQALDLHRKKAFEYAQRSSELKLALEKYLNEIKESRQQISEKSSACEAETFKHNRLQEELSSIRRKVERIRKNEAPETPDIVLVEQVRECKEMLTCQSCKVRRKDAVLTKCFHVFCWECLRTRYETRQRKCPKCNATFGANDYHRLFFAN